MTHLTVVGGNGKDSGEGTDSDIRVLTLCFSNQLYRIKFVIENTPHSQKILDIEDVRWNLEGRGFGGSSFERIGPTHGIGDLLHHYVSFAENIGLRVSVTERSTMPLYYKVRFDMHDSRRLFKWMYDTHVFTSVSRDKFLARDPACFKDMMDYAMQQLDKTYTTEFFDLSS